MLGERVSAGASGDGLVGARHVSLGGKWSRGMQESAGLTGGWLAEVGRGWQRSERQRSSRSVGGREVKERGRAREGCRGRNGVGGAFVWATCACWR